MRQAVRSLSLLVLSFIFWTAIRAETVERDLRVTSGSTIEVVNRSGKVGIQAVADTKEKPAKPRLSATGSGLSESDLKVTGAGGRTVVTVDPKDKSKRIDI